MKFSARRAEEHRLALGLNRRAAGKVIGITGQAVANIESGAVPSAETLAAMAHAYGVALEDFYEQVNGDGPG